MLASKLSVEQNVGI